MLNPYKEFSRIWNEVCNECQELYGITTSNNAAFVAGTIFNEFSHNKFFTYAECGVYKGTTFFPIYHLCRKMFKNFVMYALDSFTGFPEDIALNEQDEYQNFEILFQDGRITKEHLEKAKERCTRLQKKEHLTTDYFGDYANDFFQKCAGKPEIKIVKGSFNDLQSNFTNGRDRCNLVFLDCDLYWSYKHCLDFFNNKTDIFVFDEYYSHKYPGARIACDEFVDINHDWKFFNKIESGPYFERWGMKRANGKE